MLVICECRDNPDASKARAAARDAHRNYLKSNTAVLRLAGPMLDDNGASVGSILIVDVDTVDAAKSFVAADPFSPAGVFADVAYKPFNPTINSFTLFATSKRNAPCRFP